MICTHSTTKTSYEKRRTLPLTLTYRRTTLLLPVPRECLFHPGMAAPRLVGRREMGSVRGILTVLKRIETPHGVGKNGWVKMLHRIDSNGAKIDRGGNGEVAIPPVAQIRASGNNMAIRRAGTRTCRIVKGIDTCRNQIASIGIRLGQRLGTLNVTNGMSTHPEINFQRNGTAMTVVLKMTECILPLRVDLKVTM